MALTEEERRVVDAATAKLLGEPFYVGRRVRLSRGAQNVPDCRIHGLKAIVVKTYDDTGCLIRFDDDHEDTCSTYWLEPA